MIHAERDWPVIQAGRDSEPFFARTCFTRALREHAGMMPLTRPKWSRIRLGWNIDWDSLTNGQEQAELQHWIRRGFCAPRPPACSARALLSIPCSTPIRAGPTSTGRVSWTAWDGPSTNGSTPNERRVAEDRRDCYRLLHRHRLSRRLQAPGPHPRPGPLRLERGDESRALLLVGERVDSADAGTGRAGTLRRAGRAVKQSAAGCASNGRRFQNTHRALNRAVVCLRMPVQ